MNQPIEIYSYLNYRDYLKDFFAGSDKSFRQWARSCAIGSPNYFQQVIKGARRLTITTGEKIAAGFGLDQHEQQYFLTLVDIDLATDEAEIQELLDRLKTILVKAGRSLIKDASIHSSWLHAVLWEMARLKDQVLEVNTVAAKLRGLASKKEIQDSLDYLLSKGYLVPAEAPHTFTQKAISFQPLNDVRRIEIQQFHRRMLDIAKHRLNDGVEDREFQGLTVAIPETRMDEIRDRIRNFIVDLNADLSDQPTTDSIVHIHCSAFKLTAD
jgi:uncharacterized protein (TIGR02147 family)